VGKEIQAERFEAEDFASFAEHLHDETRLLERWLREKRFDQSAYATGFELEAWLLDRNFFPYACNDVFLDRLNSPLVVPELSKFNVELNGTPQALTGRGLRAMEQELTRTWRQCLDVAHELEGTLVMIGILPTVREEDLGLESISGRNRYHALNREVLKRRRWRPIRLDIAGREHLQLAHSNVLLEAATTSFQVHLQAPANDAVRYYNASMILSAPMVAMAANSPFLFGKCLWEETRVPLFEQSVDTGEQTAPERKRATFGCGYLQHSPMEIFLQNERAYPVLLPSRFDEAAERFLYLRLQNGTIWRWNRLLIGVDEPHAPHLRIEHRVMPAGPTIVDMMANAAVYLGAARFLAGLRRPPEDDLPFERCRDNFYRAAKDGLDARIVWLDGREAPVREVILDEILHMAREGLVLLGVDRDDMHRYLDLVAARVRTGQNGAAWQRAHAQKHGRDLFRLTADYLEHQRSAVPVHEWSL
jgi:gamma-glutamyl:cysteine ligase YbdK (ATP-grasp superfamily)